VEQKLELDALRAAADELHRRLAATHRQLSDETARRLAAEDEGARLRAGAGRAEELAAQVAAERWVEVGWMGGWGWVGVGALWLYIAGEMCDQPNTNCQRC
jgi:hypothetical protein